MNERDYPKTLSQFQSLFADEAACRQYVIASRWPNGFRCPSCGHSAAIELNARPLLQCAGCRRQVSVTAGTTMHGTRTPLTVWFRAAYLVSTHGPGFSALQLQRQLGLKRYETVWAMLQKLRRAMVRPERDCLSGAVEVDETYVGGVEEGRRGGRSKAGNKAVVVGAAEIRGEGTGRIRMAVVPDVSAESLVGFVVSAVEPGTAVYSDAWQGYASLRRRGYDHRPETQGNPKNATTQLPRVHRVFMHLKTWLWGTHRGVSRKHLPHYLDEFVFRFNRRHTPMAAFRSLLGLAGQHGPTTYKMLYEAERIG